MVNTHICERLIGIQKMLEGVHRGGSPMSATTKGDERAQFINKFLSKVMPPTYRFGSGDVTDSKGNLSGQLDIVIEYPFAPSLPLGDGESRLYLAEGVAAAIEVKSDVASQWEEARRTAEKLAMVSREIGAVLTRNNGPRPQIPLYVVGYTGWKQSETVEQNLLANPSIAGVLVIDPGIFVCRPEYGDIKATGARALWGLVSSLYLAVSSLMLAVNEPQRYVMD